MAEVSPLRLLAEDAEDLSVIAASLQDAVGQVGDIRYEPRSRRLTLGLNRYVWEARGRRRVRCGLQFSSVLSVQSRNIRRTPKDAVVELLTIAFTPGEAPAGLVTLTFAGDGDLRLEVECLDVTLADVSQTWSTPRTPKHRG